MNKLPLLSRKAYSQPSSSLLAKACATTPFKCNSLLERFYYWYCPLKWAYAILSKHGPDFWLHRGLKTWGVTYFAPGGREFFWRDMDLLTLILRVDREAPRVLLLTTDFSMREDVNT